MAYGGGYAGGYSDAVGLVRTLEIEFDAGVWTDVFADAVQVSTKRGKNRELGAYETGTLTVTLRNDDRRYDPDHTTGPYYGKLRPNRQVRFRATYNGTTYPVFVGYIDRITQQWGGPNDATAEIDVSDRFKILNRVELPSSVYVSEVLADNPYRWWRLGEPSGATTAIDQVAAAVAEVAGTPTFGEAGIIVRDPDSAMGLDGTGGDGIVSYGGVSLSSASSFSIEFWHRPSAFDTFDLIVALDIMGTDGNSLIRVGIDMTSTGTNGPWWSIITSTGVLHEYFVASAMAVDTDHHIVAVYDAGTMRLYHNGAAVGTPVPVAGSFTVGHVFAFGGPAIGDGKFSPTGTLDELAFYSTALSPARIAAHNSAGRTPWSGELPGARLERVLTLAEAATDIDLDDGTTTLQSSSLGGTVLNYAQTVEATELGALFIERDGTLRFVGRNTMLTGDYLTSQATFVDADSGAGLPYRSAEADVDEAELITRATVSRDGSVAVTYSDAAAIDEFQVIDTNVEGLFHDTDARSYAYAQWLVNTHKEPRSRVGAVVVELEADPATLYPAVLDLELTERVTWKRKPQNTGAVITKEMRVDSIAHATGGKYWTTTLQLSPFDLGEDGYPIFVWDTTEWDEHVWGL